MLQGLRSHTGLAGGLYRLDGFQSGCHGYDAPGGLRTKLVDWTAQTDCWLMKMSERGREKVKERK